MAPLENLLSQGTIERLGWTLVHFVWQATAVAVLVALVLRLLRRSAASLRYVVACLAMALMVALPVVTMQFVEVEGPVAEVGPPPAQSPAVTPVDIVEVEALPEFSGTPMPLETADLAAPVPWRQRIAMAIEPALPYVVLGWLIGVLGLSAWHLGGWAQLQRLKRRLVREVSDPLRAKLDELADRLGVQRAVTLLESAVVEVPTVVGWLRPVILLPASALTGLSPDQLEALLAHELAHIGRYDYLVNVLQTVVEILGFYHPGVWWVSHRIRVERENCCDDLAVRLCGDSVRYARALTRLEEMRHRHAELAVAASGGHLVGRIGRLLGRPAIDDRRFAWLPGLVALLMVAACVVPTALVLAAPEPPVPAAEETLNDKSEQPPVEKPSESAYAIRVGVAVLEALSNAPVDADTADQVRRLLGGTETTDSADRPVETTLDALLPDAGELELTNEEADTLVSLLGSRGLARIVARPTMEMWDGQPGRISTGHIRGPNEPPDATQDELTLHVRPEALPEGDTTLLILELELKRTLPLGPGDDKPGTHVTSIATTVMAQNGYHMLIRRHEREPFVDHAGHATMTLLLVKPTLVPIEPPAGARQAPKSPRQPAEPAATRLLFQEAADAKEASQDTAVQVLLEVIVSEVLSNVTLDDLMAKDVQHLLQETYLAQKPGLGGSKYLPSVKNLQRPLSEVLQEYVIQPKVSGAGLKMLTDMLRTRGLAHTVAAPHIPTRVGQPAKLVMGGRGNDDVVTGATDADRFGLVLDITPSLSDDLDTLALETTLELRNFTGRMMAGQEDSPWLKFDSASVRGMSVIVHDGEYHLTAPSGIERKDQAGHLRMLLVLTKATVVGDRPPPSPGEEAPVRVLAEATAEEHPSEEDRADILLDFRVAEVRADRPMTREMAQEVADLLGELRTETDGDDRKLTSRPSVDELEIPPPELFERYAQDGCWDRLVFDAVIDLLESNEYMKTICSPKLLTREDKQDHIKIAGEKYSQTTPVGVETVEAGVVINTTPHLRADGLVVLELAVEVTDLIPADEHSAPAVHKRSRQTKLAVRDNTYFVLPLHEMPTDAPKHELYLLVRPQIISPAAGIGNDRPAQKTALTPEWLLARQEYVNADPVVQELARRIAQLEVDLFEARQSFTPQHPTIVQKEALLKALEEKLEQRRTKLERQFNESLSGPPEATTSHATVQDEYLVYRPITMRFARENLRIALQDVARVAGVPIRVDPDVTGEVTATLENARLETAFEILLAGTPYVVKQERDHYRVTKPRDRNSRPVPESSGERSVSPEARLMFRSTPEQDDEGETARSESGSTAHVMMDFRMVELLTGVTIDRPNAEHIREFLLGMEKAKRSNRVVPSIQDLQSDPQHAITTYLQEGTPFAEDATALLNLLQSAGCARVQSGPQVLIQAGKRSEIAVVTDAYSVLNGSADGLAEKPGSQVAEANDLARFTVTAWPHQENNTITFDLGTEIKYSMPPGPDHPHDAPSVRSVAVRTKATTRDGEHIIVPLWDSADERLFFATAAAHIVRPTVSSRPLADGKIRGVVRDERGRPAAGALVLPLPHGGHAVETDEEGRFVLEGPTEDRVIKELLARDPRRDLAGTAQLRDPNEPISIAVTAAVTFAGRVTDPQGRPIAGAGVSPTIKGDDYGAGFGWTRWEPTDGNGVFELRALPTGYEYAIHAAAQGYGRQRQTLERIGEPGEKKLDNFVLPPADQSVSGVVLDEDDKPMAGVWVQAYGGHQPPRRAQADSAGRFTIDGLCRGPVKLWAWTSDNVWGGGDEAVAGDEKVEIYMHATRPCMLGPKNPPPSLVGRPMPSLADLNVTLAEADIRSKRVLVCFWKFSHDESRDCIRYLARRADELERRGIVVVGVQIWIRNEAQLRRWLAKNGVTFPVGMLDDLWQQRPEERATYRWGLTGSLPWLVLTDAQHIVVAEGFALNELDAKIAGAEQATTEGAGKKKLAIEIEARLLWAGEMFLKDLRLGRPSMASQ